MNCHLVSTFMEQVWEMLLNKPYKVYTKGHRS